jgi:arsenate reductase-like glutaredoxin family protein
MEKTETLITRNFEKPATEITKEEFVKWMTEDIENARVIYRKLSDEKAERLFAEDCERHKTNRENKIKKIIEESYKLYKREFYRNRWVENEIAKLPETIKRGYCHFGRDLTSVKWDLEPGVNGGGSRIGFQGDYKTSLENIYDYSIKNKYFINCTGWSIVHENLSFEEFKLHLSDEMQAEWDDEFRKLAEDIQRFYATCRYCGD